MTYSRRAFWALAAGSMTALAADRPKLNMIVRSQRPVDLEMPLEGFSTWITPIDRFFVRTHVYAPSVELGSWRLQVDGEVRQPLKLTMEDLKRLPKMELVSVMECAGNGRSQYQPPVPGLQWKIGAVGNGRWTGVRLSDVLKKAGLKESAHDVLFDGADVPLGTMQDFQRSVPLSKCMHPDTMLAYEMNGEALPVAHGFPLRLVVPGWASDSWTKWVTRIRVLDKEADTFWMKTAYRHPGRPVAPGTAVDPAKMHPVESLRPKSVIATPQDQSFVKPGSTVKVSGVAWSGESPIASVEVSEDRGRTWKAARLGKDQARYGWRMWEATWTPKQPGYYILNARVHDTSGATQPMIQEWNPSGYLWNVTPQVGVNIETQEPPAATPAPNAGPAALPSELKSSCVGCHGADVMEQQRLTRGQWDKEIDKMVRWGAQVKPEDRPAILEFLASHFGLGK